MTVVGVTGKYCAGKNTVAALLVDRGYHEIDVDRVGHEALVSEAERIVDAFGARVQAADGSINRKTLGTIVFSDEAELRRLEAIVHPVMVSTVRDRIHDAADHGRKRIVVNAAILFRMGLDELCSTVLHVTAPLLIRLRRARERDNATVRSFLKRLRSQRDVSPQFSRYNADIQRVVNDGRAGLLEQLQERVPLA